MASWRSIAELSIPPKVHCLEDHAHVQFSDLDGLFDFREDWVERLHQMGLKDNLRSKGMRDKARKFLSHSKWEQMAHHRGVDAMKREVDDSRKRNLKNPPKENKAETRKKTRLEVRDQTLADFVVQPRSESAFELNMALYREQREADDED